MEPIKFKEQNCTFAEDQPQYRPLPAFKDPGEQGQVISCWKLSFKERMTILFTGKMWMSLMMFGNPLTPSILSVKKSEVLEQLHWAIRLRKKLLINGTWKWNAWIRDFTAKLELKF